MTRSLLRSCGKASQTALSPAVPIRVAKRTVEVQAAEMADKIEYEPCAREVLTTMSAACVDARHDDCHGLLRVQDVIAVVPPVWTGRMVLCICTCHTRPETAN